MIERTYNNKRQIIDPEFQEIVKNEIVLSKKVENENPDNIVLHQLSTSMGMYFLQFHFSDLSYASFKFDEDGHKLLENRLEDKSSVIYNVIIPSSKPFIEIF